MKTNQPNRRPTTEQSAQAMAMSHQLHLQSITTLTTLYEKLKADDTTLRSTLDSALLELLQPFLPPAPPSQIIS